MQYIDSHPELAAQGFDIKSAIDVTCSQKKILYVLADPSACGSRRRRGRRRSRSPPSSCSA